jgi:thiamine-phosphate pyrophosphorylase
MSLTLPRLYPILDSTFLPSDADVRERHLIDLARELLAAGVTLLQYRNKSASDDEVLADAMVLRRALPMGKCLLILNDRPHLVALSCFDGVHIGQDDVSAAEARAMIGFQRVLGLSTHSAEQLRAGDATSANYLAIGPVFATRSKRNPDPVVGLEGVRVARGITRKPLVAIGGIGLENAAGVLDAGADSVAVISSVFAHHSEDSPGLMVRKFLAL